MHLCLSKLTCVAVDTWSDVCSLHTNASDLLSSHATSGVSQFVLDRSCAVSTASASSTETTFSTVSDTGFCAILSQFSSYYSVCNLPLVLWCCRLGGRKAIRLVKTEWWGASVVVSSVCSKVQTCIWPSWCHFHSLSLASVKSRLVLPCWYRLTWVVPEKGPLNGCMCTRIVCVTFHFIVCCFSKFCNVLKVSNQRLWSYDLFALYKSVYYYYLLLLFFDPR